MSDSHSESVVEQFHRGEVQLWMLSHRFEDEPLGVMMVKTESGSAYPAWESLEAAEAHFSRIQSEIPGCGLIRVGVDELRELLRNVHPSGFASGAKIPIKLVG